MEVTLLYDINDSPSLPFQFQALVTHMVLSRIISGPNTYSIGRKAEPIPCKHEYIRIIKDSRQCHKTSHKIPNSMNTIQRLQPSESNDTCCYHVYHVSVSGGFGAFQEIVPQFTEGGALHIYQTWP